MKRRELFSIGDFAKFARTTRDTLVHYDKIGLLSPSVRGENNYRYYSVGDLAMFNLIRTFQQFGISLDEIKRFRNNRTPELADIFFDDQIKNIDDKIEVWVRARNLLHLFKTTIHSQLDVDETEIKVQFRPAEAIVLGDLNDYSRDRNDYDALISFYYNIQDKYPNLDLNYPVWGMFSEERIKSGDWKWPDRYYFYNPEGYDKKPAHSYAVGYTRGSYGQSHELYMRLLDYIDANGYEICGPAFEEYPLNEICVQESDNYLIRIMITVRKSKRITSFP